MEISYLSPDSIKIKGKNASIVFDPNTKTDAEIIIATKALGALEIEKVSGTRLIISGQGEYEVGGISVSGKRVKDSFVFTITEGMKIIVANSSTVQELADDEEFDAVVIHVTEPFSGDSLGPVNAKSIVLYGDLALAKTDSENQERTSKVNLKKTSEVQGKTFLLE